MNQSQLAEAAVSFYRTANGSQHPLRNILLRIPADSSDLLAIIQREGAVLLQPRHRSLAEVLATIPNVGEDADFARVQESGAVHVFD